MNLLHYALGLSAIGMDVMESLPLRLIEAGVPLEDKGFGGASVLGAYLQTASTKTVKLELVRLLVERGANLQATNYAGESILQICQQLERQDITEYLLSVGAR
jgi:hypothetical protein